MNEQGLASSIVSTGQQIGGAVGLAVIMAIISSSLGTNTPMESMDPGDLNGAIRIAFIINTVTTLIGILVGFRYAQTENGISRYEC